MADKISATITYLDSRQNKGSKAITDISPTADNGAIKNFCVGLLGLTTNTLSQIDRIEKTDITAATTKPKLTLEVDNTELANMKFDNTGAAYRFAKFPNTIGLPWPKLTVDITAWDEEGREIGAFWGSNNFVSAGFARMSGDYIIGVCTMGETGGSRYLHSALVNFYFEETETTVATQYRLTITRNAGEATFVQM